MAKTCERCGATCIWGKRKGYAPKQPGAFELLDAEPSPIGIFVIIDGRMQVADVGTDPDVPKYTPHRATCARQQGRERAAMERA